MTTTTDEQNQTAIIEYWLGDAQRDPECMAARGQLWYAGDVKVDEEIKRKFGELYELACEERITHWGTRSHGSLALVILLDQFSRNFHRGSSKAFAQDQLARAIAKRAISTQQNLELSIIGQLFLIHPLHHSENLVDQEQAVAYVEQLHSGASPEWRKPIQGFLNYCVEHRDVVRRFKRFPHRNAVLSRESTAEEIAYLENAPRYGQ